MDLIAKELTLFSEDEYHLNNISFGMRRGEIYTLLGRTLSGKTTLLKTIAGLISPDSGRVLFDGVDFASAPVWERNIAMVYQQFINYPHLTVFDNVAFPLRQRKLDAGSIQSRVDNALDKVGLNGFADRKIQALSGGQQQRVALARSLAKQAQIVLLDEPLVNLDYKLREQLREEFRNIFSGEMASQSILIYSTTDPLEAMQMGGEIIVMDEARILQQGPAHVVFENPVNTRVAEIANDPAMNLVDGQIAEGKIIINDEMTLPIPQHFKTLSSGDYRFGIRATDISLDQKKGIKFRLELSEISGSETFLHVVNGQHKVVALVEGVHEFRLDQQIKLSLEPDRLYAFDTKGDLVSSPYSKEK